MKNIILLFCYFLIVQQALAQYTQVPDPNFEQALIDLGIDSEGILDGQFLTADAIGVLELLIQERSISDLTGIEAFTDLLSLVAFENNLSSINLSILPITLHSLFLGNNNLTSIDLSPIPNIVNLSLHSNNFTQINASNLTHMFALYLGANTLLTSIFVLNCSNLQNIGLQETSVINIDLSECPSLRNFNAQDSQIQTLDFTYNQNLEDVKAFNSTLTSINLPNNPDLIYLSVGNTQLTELDVTNCPNLEELHFTNIGLTTIDVTQNTNLERLFFKDNQITNLDITQNSNLIKIDCRNNLLQSIELSNNLNLLEFVCSNNPIDEFINIQGAVSLEKLFSSETNILEADLSQNFNLIQVVFFQCQNLEFVNLQNGNNENLGIFLGTQCPNLSCVVVDDPLADNDNILVDSNTILVGNVEDCNLSISDNVLQNLINVFPNPVHDILRIDNSSIYIINCIKVYDVLGRIVLQENNPTSQLDLSNITSGLLFVIIETNRGFVTKKVVKE